VATPDLRTLWTFSLCRHRSVGRTLRSVAGNDFVYVTTRGRVTGQPHEIEIWYGRRHDTIYLLAGGGGDADWVRNVQADPVVDLRVEEEKHRGTARIVTDPDEDVIARMLVFEKYRHRSGDSLDDWRERALPVAIDLVTIEADEAAEISRTS